MKRYILDELAQWKDNPNHKPLILRGARQTGKTWIMQHFAEQYSNNYIYINFEDNQLLEHLFERDFDMDRISLEIEVATGKRLTERTLLLLDEIQEVKRGITALKYFYEKRPDISVIAAGSLLGLAMHNNDSFPVGKVEFMPVYPLSFCEFLEAMDESGLVRLIQECRYGMLATFANKLEAYLKQYFYIGGMPEVVAAFAQNKDFRAARKIQMQILNSYEQDFSKHAPAKEVPRIRMVWNSIVAQLSKENKKFIYGLIKEGARAKDFELALERLRDAGLIYKVPRTKKGLLPLSAYEDFSAFKVYLSDIGLLGAMAELPAEAFLHSSTFFTDFKGALTEQFVFEQLRLDSTNRFFYWSQEQSQGEIDFLVQRESTIIPIEVKAAENLRAKSLRLFVSSYEGLHGVRFSLSPYREQEWMTNYPLYTAETALKKKQE